MIGFTLCFGLSKAEVQFVLGFPGINDQDKIVWIMLALLSHDDPEFANKISFHQFCKTLNFRKRNVLHALKKLEDMGFLSTNGLGEKLTHPPNPHKENGLIGKIPYKWLIRKNQDMHIN